MIRIIEMVLEPGAKQPTRATAGAAGYDLYARMPLTESPCMALAIIEPSERQIINTGVRVAIPPGYEGQVRPRSGMAEEGIDVILGTIDSDYRGPIGVIVVNRSAKTFACTADTRIAQLVIAPVISVEWAQVRSLPATDRGDGGFGSTGGQ